MKIERKLKDIPRKEIDKLERILDKILKNEGYFSYSSQRWTETGWKPEAGITFTYSEGRTKEAATLVGEGTTKEGDFEIAFSLNLTDNAYTILVHNLEKNAPILAKSFPKMPSYS